MATHAKVKRVNPSQNVSYLERHCQRVTVDVRLSYQRMMLVEEQGERRKRLRKSHLSDFSSPALLKCYIHPALLKCYAHPALLKCYTHPALLKCYAHPALLKCYTHVVYG